MELRNRIVGANKSNIVIMQRSQSKIVRATSNAPWYVTNHTVPTDFDTPYLNDVYQERINITTTWKPIPIQY